jgi:orotate phosphoribosyltransferase
MAGERERFLAILKEKSYEKKRVVLSSGRESDFYIDCKQATLDAEGAILTGRLLCEMLEEDGMAEAVGGITLGADPIVTAVSLTSALRGNPIPAFIIRVVTTGASTLRAIERAEEAGLVVSRVLCLVDRNEGGAEFLAEKGYRLEPMFRKEDVESA